MMARRASSAEWIVKSSAVGEDSGAVALCGVLCMDDVTRMGSLFSKAGVAFWRFSFFLSLRREVSSVGFSTSFGGVMVCHGSGRITSRLAGLLLSESGCWACSSACISRSALNIFAPRPAAIRRKINRVLSIMLNI